MATRTSVELIDDINGGKADETISFSIDGVDYEIDLNAKNASKLRKDLIPYAESARRLSKNGKATRRVPVEVDAKAVRAWAASNGFELSARGRVPTHIIEQYQAAGN